VAEDKHQRTEKPTQRKKDKARRKGQVVKSNELKAAVMTVTAAIALKSLGPGMKLSITERFVGSFTELFRTPVTMETVPILAADWIKWGAGLLAPLLTILVVVGLAVNALIMGGIVLSTQSIGFNPGKLNPVSGAKQLFSSKNVFKLFADGVKLVLIGLVCFYAVKGMIPVLLTHIDVGLWDIMRNVSGMVLSILLKSGFVLLLIGVADFAYRRRSHISDLKMSKRELKDEAKETEGDPLVRGRIRSAQKELLRKRMMQAVPDATVVLTNPTHIAVALKYLPETMDAPVVVAKGKRLIAEKIKQIAEEHDVPVVENKPLAQSLYKMVEVGGEIPAKLYRAVAEVLSYVYKLKGRLNPVG
jgi:flagellar biosynthetic protein FlhB